MTEKKGRTIEVSLEIDAPSGEVWKALTDAKELVRWFPLEAEIEPRPGGRYWMSWGGEYEGESRIEIFEPERQLRTTMPSMTKKDGRPVELAVDYHLEGRGGRTVLRLVHSGFGRGADWDGEYDAIRTGWTFELRSLRHYLEHHRGRDRHAIFVVGPKAELSAPDVWRRVLAEVVGMDEPGALAEGERYSFALAGGETFAGVVLDCQPLRQFAGTVDALGDGIFRIEVFAARPHLWLAVWGRGPEALAPFEARWRGALDRVFTATGSGGRGAQE
jgi:uncharacterized protein YndB with AHSA1/START domain